MGKDNGRIDEKRVAKESKQALDEILREGARRMLQSAIEAEVAEYVEKHKEIVDEETGHRKLVRNGHQPERTIQSALGDIPVKKPRAHDRREGKKFTSSILPPYMRTTPNIEALIPVLYLKGVATNDFPADHWVHIRTTNPIESTFATVRHRSRQTKGCGSRKPPHCHGLQAGQGSREEVAEAQQLPHHRQGHPGRGVQGRRGSQQ